MSFGYFVAWDKNVGFLSCFLRCNLDVVFLVVFFLGVLVDEVCFFFEMLWYFIIVFFLSLGICIFCCVLYRVMYKVRFLLNVGVYW